jgi:hypothetical protein
MNDNTTTTPAESAEFRDKHCICEPYFGVATGCTIHDKTAESAEKLELLPCPFCEGDDAFVERADYSSCFVQCNDCSAQGPTKCQESDDEDTPGEHAAIVAWNRRAETAELRRERDALKQRLKAAEAVVDHYADTENWMEHFDRSGDSEHPEYQPLYRGYKVNGRDKAAEFRRQYPEAAEEEQTDG